MGIIVDGKGRVVGRFVGEGIGYSPATLLDGKGHKVASFNKSSNRTLDGKGKNVGVGDQRLKQLGK